MSIKHTEIYRIENEKGEGVYRAESRSIYFVVNEVKADYQDYQNERRHPTPDRDSKLVDSLPRKAFFGNSKVDPIIDCNYISNFIFGFSSVDQLRMWFFNNNILVGLHNCGFKVVVYKGEVYHGNTQAVIRKSTRKKVKEISLLSLTETEK